MVDTVNGNTTANGTGPVVGFLGLGIMGQAMARNLLKSGKFANVVVWNRTLSKVRVGGWVCVAAAQHQHPCSHRSMSHCPAPQCDQLVAEGAIAAATPAEVVQQCDITFAMLADPEAALKVRTMCLCAAAHGQQQ